MIPYETFFIFILVSILGPIISLFAAIFYDMTEKKIYLLEVENKQMILEKELEVSKYNQLNQQIQPHFLFNALNSLLSLIRLKRYENLAQSFEHMILFLRTKYEDKKQLQLLKKEIDYTSHYLAIQSLRFGERLKVKWDIDPVIGQALVIPFLVQTLVENAFKHGFEKIEGDAILEIKIYQETAADHNKKVCLVVQDNGPGFIDQPLSKRTEGHGLFNIKKRLELLFGDLAKVNFENELDGGAKVIVTWPLLYKNEAEDCS